ncbi:FecR family protein [Fulvivirga lutimaris]|uniref:FecR family protein n=1 Tax=Fulvivirga lutimaris TaxID=1819566 RepID=UPI0012BCFB52|nr:FecR family protein [Fulvivirga lutimaris]MTI40348.1 FecR family protein [Fulvivirga lutimaris]
MEELNKDNDLLIRWINGDLSDEKLAAFEQSDDFLKYKAIITEVDQWQVAPLDLEKSFEELEKKKLTGKKAKVIPWYNQPMVRWAAVFAFLATAIVYFVVKSNETTTYETTFGESKEVVLPDNSKVTLGPNSSIAFKRKSWGKKRRDIRQKGTAYYEVEKGTPFTVDFDQSKLTVLGTSFEIISSPQFSAVSCYDGKVLVNANDNEVTLTKGMGVNIKNKKIDPFNFKHSWSSDLKQFTSTPISVVLESIENQYDIKIDASQINAEQLFTGAYIPNSKEKALEMVCKPMNISFKIDGQSVTLQ